MGFEVVPGWTTYNQYGPRTSNEDSVGVYKNDGLVQELVIPFDATSLQDYFDDGTSRALAITKIPAGSTIVEVILRVDTAITTSAVDKDLYVGTAGSESTNGATFADTDIDDAGTYKVLAASLNGTWAAELAADTLVGFDFEATVTAISTGEGAVIIRYMKSN
jgi:hypothetical protein